VAEYQLVSGIEVDTGLRAFVEDEVLPGTGLEADAFWRGFSSLLRELTPENKRLLRKRETLQAAIDERNRSLAGRAPDPAEEEGFLREIGYLVDAPAPFTIGTQNVDPEIARMAGPQLVVPVNNARYALNAANARWGSLYDALYGTDVLGDLPKGGGYDPARGARVIAWAKAFLDEAVPLAPANGATSGLRATASRSAAPINISAAASAGSCSATTVCISNWCSTRTIRSAATIRPASPTCCSKARSPRSWIARTPFAAVDAEEKIGVYRNWLGLMRGDLSASFAKGGGTVERRLEPTGPTPRRTGAR
jgi:malate synthase